MKDSIFIFISICITYSKEYNDYFFRIAHEKNLKENTIVQKFVSQDTACKLIEKYHLTCKPDDNGKFVHFSRSACKMFLLK